MKRDEENFYKKIGTQIRNIRDQKGITQDRLAQKLGFSQSYLSDLENALKPISALTLVKIANCLEVSCDTLCKGTNGDDLLTDLSNYIKLKYNSCPCDDTTYEYLSLEIDTAFLKFLYKTAVADHIPALSEKIRNDLDTEAKQSFYNETEKQTCSFIPLSESQIVKDNTPPNRWNQFELMQLTNDSIAKLFD